MNALLVEPGILESVVSQHAEETMHLLVQRTHLLDAPGAPWLALERIDDRLAAHVDGLRVAGACGRALCEAQAAADELPEVARFAAAVLALEAGDHEAVGLLLNRPGVPAGVDAGTLAAVSWVSPRFLRGIVAAWLRSDLPAEQVAALTAVAAHGVDPGAPLATFVDSADGNVAVAACRAAVASGRCDVLSALRARAGDHQPMVAFEAARAGLLLGDRTWSLDMLDRLVDDGVGLPALRLQLMALDIHDGRARLKRLSAGPQRDRLLVQGTAFVGDPALLPWLMQKVQDLALSRLAGASIAAITGLDLAAQGLDRPRPPDAPAILSDDPAEPDVETDEDDSLLWPDPDKLSEWSTHHGSAWTGGTRLLMGAPLSPAHVLDVLARGLNGQRIAAADHLCLLQPGTARFNTSAPAWRQARRLAALRP